MNTDPPPGYLGSQARITAGPAPELVEAGYALELADAPLLHDGLGLADLAHVIGLTERGLLPDQVTGPLLTGLLELLEVPVADFGYDVRYGDAYNSREKVLTARLGDLAGWVHLGRTRREAGRIAFRLALREQLLQLSAAVQHFAEALADRAGEHAGTIWVDSTYLQPAQPSTFGQYLASFGQETARHLDRIAAAHAWADRSPAGSGGVAGTRLGLDRARLAELLGFGSVGANIRDTMWNVDGLADAVLAAVQAATTADRLAEDLLILTSPGFALVELDAALCRASVLMPQKRNPYALAVIRSGAGTLIGRLGGLLTVARTPSAQTDNWLHAYGEVTDALALGTRLVRLAARVVQTLVVDVDAMARAAARDAVPIAATDLADELVLRAGLDYRTGYRIAGRAVASALGTSASTGAGSSTSIGTGSGPRLTVADLDRAAREVTGIPLPTAVVDDPGWLATVLDPAQVVATRTEPGGCGPQQLAAELAALRPRLTAAGQWRQNRSRAAERARDELVALARNLAAG